jgi:hypothetical protein
MRVAFVIDPDIFGDGNNKKDAESARDELKDILGLDLSPKVFDTVTDSLLIKTWDLILIDYGGMGMLGAAGLAASNVKYLLGYAEAHPSCLLILWTQYTVDVYERELGVEIDPAKNILIRDVGGSWIKTARQWFSVKCEGK